MIRAIDSQEVQLALQPSMATGLTLAETVEWKLKDVNGRIVICTRIMLAAKDNVRIAHFSTLDDSMSLLFTIVTNVPPIKTSLYSLIDSNMRLSWNNVRFDCSANIRL